VVCQEYRAPDKIDPKFFDIKFVFSEVENAQADTNKKVKDMFKGEMGIRNRGGYADGDYTLYHRLNVSDFVTKDNFIELLANSNEVCRYLRNFLIFTKINRLSFNFEFCLDCFR
jgi:AdoMet-dependent rRNA methyltransferase SPB1